MKTRNGTASGDGKARGWMESHGTRVESLIRDPTGGQGGFHRNPKHVESVLWLFEKLDR